MSIILYIYDRSNYKILYDYYEKYNKIKIDRVPSIYQKYHSELHILAEKLRNIFGVIPEFTVNVAEYYILYY